MESASGEWHVPTYSDCLTGQLLDDIRKLYPDTSHSWTEGTGGFAESPKRLGEACSDFRIRPYVRTRDLNNSTDSPCENRPRNSVEFGVKFSF